MILKKIFKKLYTTLKDGLMKELVGLLKRFILNKVTFQLLELYQGVIIFNRLPVELRNSKKELINIKNNDQKRFLWCHIRYNNPVKIHTERITKQDKELINTLDYEKNDFLCLKKILIKLKWKTKFVSMFVVMKTNWFILFTYQIKNLKIQWICW